MIRHAMSAGAPTLHLRSVPLPVQPQQDGQKLKLLNLHAPHNHKSSIAAATFAACSHAWHDADPLTLRVHAWDWSAVHRYRGQAKHRE